MSMIDKLLAAITPSKSDQERSEARRKASAATYPGDWLAMVLDHHVQIEEAFAAVKAAQAAALRLAAHKRLAVMLIGHSDAEESVLYPALARADEKGHAAAAYAEQADTKMEMAELETLPPMSRAYMEALEHIRVIVAHHMYEEESSWFLELKQKTTAPDQVKLSRRYQEEFDRYVGMGVAFEQVYGEMGRSDHATATPRQRRPLVSAS
jgi:hypothetical protein